MTKSGFPPPDGTRAAAVAATMQDGLYVGDEPKTVDHSAEVARARALAERYRLEFVDMDTFRIEAELFRSIPADLMLRYGFVPDRKDGPTLVIVVSDPTDLPMIDELALLLNTPIRVTVGTSSAIESILKKSEGSQRVLDEATEGFELQILHEDENAEDNLTVERLTGDISPVIRLVDSMIYTGLQRRASDIHIEPWDLAIARSEGRLVPTKIALEWNLPTEPWVFVVDRSGHVSARFEALVTTEELEATLIPLIGVR